MIDALLDAGANIEAPGAVIGGGTPLADAVAFGQWQAARRLVERGARTSLWQAAALGPARPRAGRDRRDGARAGRPDERVLAGLSRRQPRGGRGCSSTRGAELNWIGWDDQTPLDIAEAQGNREVVEWLRSRGGKPAAELR